MKKHLFFVSAFTAVLSLNAQQTVTGISPIGYSADFGPATAATASTVPVTTTGANVTWNCSGLQNSATITLSISSPAGMPYANDYTGANYNLNASVSGNLIVNEFFILNADSIVKLGAHVPGSSYEIYQNPQIDFKYPFNFNDTYTDTYAKTSYNSGGAVTSSQTGSITLTYVGYGTLILPMGTFTNIAMIKRVRTNSIGPTTTSYSWVKYPSGERMLDWDNNGGIKVNYLVSPGSVGIKENNIPNNVLIYPSISSGSFKIENLSGDESISIFNLAGEKIYSARAGAPNTEINLNAKGIFLIQVSNEKGLKSTKKIIVQ